jgi:ribosomal protein L22
VSRPEGPPRRGPDPWPQAPQAVAVLEFAPQAASETVRKVLQSAIANAG